MLNSFLWFLLFHVIQSVAWNGVRHKISLDFKNKSLAAGVDDCERVVHDYSSGYNATLFKNAMKCLESFPYQPESSRSILDTIMKTIPFYVFHDIVTHYEDQTHPLSPIRMRMNIEKELLKLNKRRFKRDKDFHDALYDLFNQLYDPHTRYISNCYHRWSFVQPWILTSFSDQIWIRHAVFVQDEASVNTLWLNTYGINITEFIGWQVTQIDGQPAMQAIQEFANTFIFMARDPNVRFNLVMNFVLFISRL
jgi:hypothetical protein